MVLLFTYLLTYSFKVRGWELASVTRDGRPVSLTRGAGSKSGGGEGGGNGSAVLGADDNCVRVFRKKMDGAFETTKTVGVVHGITGSCGACICF